METRRRDFIKQGAAIGATVGVFGASGLNAEQRQTQIPSQRTKAVMSLFDLKYPIFQARQAMRPGRLSHSLCQMLAQWVR